MGYELKIHFTISEVANRMHFHKPVQSNSCYEILGAQIRINQFLNYQERLFPFFTFAEENRSPEIFLLSSDFYELKMSGLAGDNYLSSQSISLDLDERIID